MKYPGTASLSKCPHSPLLFVTSTVLQKTRPSNSPPSLIVLLGWKKLSNDKLVVFFFEFLSMQLWSKAGLIWFSSI